MPEPNGSSDDISFGDVLVDCFRLQCENLLLRRLVTSMALNICAELLPDDERTMLLSILDGG